MKNNDGPAIQQPSTCAAAALAAAPGSKQKGAIGFSPSGAVQDRRYCRPRVSAHRLWLARNSRLRHMWATQISASEPGFPSNVPVVDFDNASGNPRVRFLPPSD